MRIEAGNGKCPTQFDDGLADRAIFQLWLVPHLLGIMHIMRHIELRQGLSACVLGFVKRASVSSGRIKPLLCCKL